MKLFQYSIQNVKEKVKSIKFSGAKLGEYLEMYYTITMYNLLYYVLYDFT